MEIVLRSWRLDAVVSLARMLERRPISVAQYELSSKEKITLIEVKALMNLSCFSLRNYPLLGAVILLLICLSLMQLYLP
jgi:hypothetical protein